MKNLWLIWLGASVAALAAMYAAKCLRERRLAGPDELYWPSLLAVSVIVGGIAAFVLDATSSRQVDVPPEVTEKIPLPARN